MNNEEIILRQRIGQHSPFAIPEGYFKHSEVNIMQRIRQQNRRIVRLRAFSAVAASLLVAAAVWSLWQFRTVPQLMENEVEFCYEAQDVDDELVSNYEIAYYLTEADL